MGQVGALRNIRNALVAVALASAAVACSSAVIGPSDAGIVCINAGSSASGRTCQIWRNWPSSMLQTLTNQCTNGGGTIGSACPTEGLVGCCTELTGSNIDTVEDCYYSGNVAQLKSMCGGGTWSATP